MVEAGKQFRRVNGHLHLRSLRDTLERHPGSWLRAYHVGAWKRYPRYDTDWSATGPLIERLRITIFPVEAWVEGYEPGGFAAVTEASISGYEFECWPGTGYQILPVGPTPLVAACTLILALAGAGKLPKEG